MRFIQQVSRFLHQNVRVSNEEKTEGEGSFEASSPEASAVEAVNRSLLLYASLCDAVAAGLPCQR
jgi:hypothetical protein